MKKTLNCRELFTLLFAAYGPQGWWPVTPRGGHDPVYRPGTYLPGNRSEQVEIAFGAVLTQNTAWNNAAKALAALHRHSITKPETLLSVDRETLQDLIRPSGYYRQKAERLAVLSDFLVNVFPWKDGKKQAGDDQDELRGALLSLRGIGPETADSILLYAFGKPVFVIDAYTRRLVTRLGWFQKDPGYDGLQEYFEAALPPGVPLFNEFHALVVELGKQHCSARPRCTGCPLAACCAGAEP